MAGLLQRLAERLDVPADALAGAPSVTVTGGTRALVEHHRGLLSYSDSEITVDCGASKIRVRGDGLLLRAMNGELLLISGRVLSVELE